MQGMAEEEQERTQGKARAQRGKLLTFSDLGESLEKIHSPLEQKGDGSWVHYSERLVVEPLEDRLIREEEHARLHEALDRLDPEAKELIVQRFGIEGDPHTLAELARARGCTPETIRLKIERIKKRLRRWLLKRQ